MTAIKHLEEQTKDMNILYVEDDDAVRQQTKIIFEMLFKNVDTAFDGEDGWQKYQNFDYDIVLTDISMPRMDGIELTRLIKEKNSIQKVVIISAHNTAEHLLKAIELDVDAFLLKPIKIDKLLLNIKRLADAFLAGKILKEYRKNLEVEVKKQTQIIEKQIVTDKLTGLHNRYALNKTLESIEQDVSLLLINIDNFDSINVVYGYDIGDQVIISLANLLAKELENNSNLFYLGNDEFAILCHKSEQDIMKYAKILQENQEELFLPTKKHKIKFTVTIAIAKGGGWK